MVWCLIRHQAITWNNIVPSVRSCSIHQGAVHKKCSRFISKLHLVTLYSWTTFYWFHTSPCLFDIALASHLCTCVLHRQLCYLHTLKLPKFFNFHGDFHQKWHFAHPEFSFAHPELPFLAKSMLFDIFPDLGDDGAKASEAPRSDPRPSTKLSAEAKAVLEDLHADSGDEETKPIQAESRGRSRPMSKRKRPQPGKRRASHIKLE